MADHHRVLPLLSRTLSSAGPEAVPGSILEQLQARFRTNAARSYVLWAELTRLLKLFETHGIAAVPFKGPALAASVYGSLFLRQAGDLDLLVHPRNVRRATEILLSQGYAPDSETTVPQGTAHRRSEFHLTFWRPEQQVEIELHWRFAPDHFAFALDLTRLWERLERISLEGTTVLALPPEELLLALCVHGTRHRWERLIWVCDIAELIRAQPGMEWRRALEQAAHLRCARILAVGLLLARDLLGADLPAEVLQRVQADPAAISLAAGVPGWLFQETKELGLIWRRELFPLRAREHLRDRLRCGLHLARRRVTPNAHDRALVPLPALFSFLYYLLRPIRLVGTYHLRPQRFRAFGGGPQPREPRG